MEKLADIHIKVIPHEDQIYSTVGNWRWVNGSLLIEISELGDADSELDVAIHELIESRLCQKHGITEHVVTQFDILFEHERESGKHSADDEPGSDKRSPYRDEHESAEFVERAAASVLGPDWFKHSKQIAELD
jgi:hypothetical protein